MRTRETEMMSTGKWRRDKSGRRNEEEREEKQREGE